MKLYETFRPVLFINGLFLVILSVGMVIPMFVDLAADNPDWSVFLGSALLTFLCGSLLAFSQAGPIDEINVKQAFMLTTTSWLVLALFAAVPLRFSNLGIGMAGAFFESMSGLTTTGSTVLVGLDTMPPGILLWRGILQGLGGIGIIVMAIAILPVLRSGGMQLFRTESSDTSVDRVVPQVARMMGGLVITYVLLTVACGIALWLAGMTPLDAIVHAMATLSTGGFSNHDASIAYFKSVKIEMIIMVFMILGALPFVAYLRSAYGKSSSFFADPQVRGLIVMLVVLTIMLSVWLVVRDGYAPLTALRYASFNITSIVTTTGFTSTNYALWGAFPIGVFFLMTFVGGCTGSTSGGIKILRFQILRRVLSAYLWRLVYPHAVRPASFGENRITSDVAVGVLIFILAFIMTAALVALILTGLGLDFDTAISGAATALGNVGPGLGKIIGPAGNFRSLPDSAKWVLAITMLLGRLEFFTVWMLFTPAYWRA